MRIAELAMQLQRFAKNRLTFGKVIVVPPFGELRHSVERNIVVERRPISTYWDTPFFSNSNPNLTLGCRSS